MAAIRKRTARQEAAREQAPPPAVPYEPTLAEQHAIAAFMDRRNARKPTPSAKLEVDAKTGATMFSADHTDQVTGLRLLMDALGTVEPAFFDAMIGQLANVSGVGKQPKERELNQLIATVKGIAPRDHVEAMLAAQMAAVHAATMTFARRLNHVENIPQQDSASNAFNKCARTFAAQVDALKRYRSSGEQKMTVEHVTVQAGGQAIVGTVNRGEGGGGKD